MPKSGISGSHGNSIFSFVRNLHTDFHSGCTNLHSHQTWWGFFFPNILTSICCLMIAILTRVKWNLTVISICISFMGIDIEHIFICLLAICNSLESCLFTYPYTTWIIYSFDAWFFWALYIFWILIPCQMYNWQRFYPTL
jgi:hypothetical protein